jgi:hypothetical protein
MTREWSRRAPVGRRRGAAVQRVRGVGDHEVQGLVGVGEYLGGVAEHQLDLRRLGRQPDQQRAARPLGGAADQPPRLSLGRPGAALPLQRLQR